MNVHKQEEYSVRSTEYVDSAAQLPSVFASPLVGNGSAETSFLCEGLAPHNLLGSDMQPLKDEHEHESFTNHCETPRRLSNKVSPGKAPRASMKEFVSAASRYIHIALWLEFRREKLMNLFAPFLARRRVITLNAGGEREKKLQRLVERETCMCDNHK